MTRRLARGKLKLYDLVVNEQKDQFKAAFDKPNCCVVVYDTNTPEAGTMLASCVCTRYLPPPPHLWPRCAILLHCKVWSQAYALELTEAPVPHLLFQGSDLTRTKIHCTSSSKPSRMI